MVMSELMMDGLDLMVIGMGSVFVFLAVLVASVSLMSKIALKLVPIDETPAHTAAEVPIHSTAGVPAAHVAAITGAVHQYKASRD